MDGIREEKILKQYIQKGYAYVHLCKNCKDTAYLVHRLLAEAFIPNPLNLPCVRHIDGVTINNESTNLEWATGKIPGQAHGEYSFNAKLTNEQAEWCRTVYIPRNKDFGAAALAKLFGVSPSTISYILNRRTYK